MNEDNNDEYFCHIEDDDRFGAQVFDKVEKWEKYLEEKNIFKLQNDVYKEKYYSHHTAGEIVEAGDKGEVKIFNLNYISHFLNGIKNMITARPMGFVPRTSKNESEAMAEVNVAKTLLENEYEENGEEERNSEAADDALDTGLAFETITWDANKGPVLDGKRLGAPRYQLHLDPDVIRDVSVRDVYDNSWFLIREYVNRHEFAQKYKDSEERPELYEKIKSQSKTRFKCTGAAMTSKKEEDRVKWEDDRIPIYRLWHERNELMPNGCRAILLEDGTVIQRENDLKYEDIPISILRVRPWRGMNFGWTPAFNMLPIQKYLRMLTTAMATNQEAGAINWMWVDESESPVKVDQMKGRALVKGKGNPPVPLSMTNTVPEVFNTYSLLTNAMGAFAAFSPAQAGDIEEGASGKAMQISIQQSEEYHQSFEKSYTQFNERKAQLIIENFQLWAAVERTIEQVGESKRNEVITFKNDDLMDVESIAIERGPSFMALTSERVKFGMFMLQNGIINPREYMTIVNTGNTDMITDKETKEDMLVKKENEMILKGENPPVSPTDNDIYHVQHHNDPMCDMDARMNPDVLRAFQAHQKLHIENIRAKQQDPIMNAVFNGNPAALAPPPPPMGMNPNQIGPPQGPGGPPMPPPAGPPPGAGMPEGPQPGM